MKMFNKSECTYKGGYIVCNDEIVGIDNEIVDLFNKLETDIQEAEFKRIECIKCPGKLLADKDSFHRKSEFGARIPRMSVKTPLMDAKFKESMELMEEIDNVDNSEKANEYFEGIMPLIEFVNDPFIVECAQPSQHRFDLPTVGNPLEVDPETLVKLVAGIFFNLDDEDEDEQE